MEEETREMLSGSPDEISAQVGGLLASLYPQNNVMERRSERRFPFPYLIHLTPVETEGNEAEGEAVVVVGKHLSTKGVGFFHPKPLPYRRMIASFETGNGAWLSFLIDLTWCRFTRQGWYESGGRFVQAVTPPFESFPQ